MKKRPYILALFLAAFFSFQLFFTLEDRIEKLNTHYLQFEYTSTKKDSTDLFWDAGSGFGEQTRTRTSLLNSNGKVLHLSFKLPAGTYQNFRMDPILRGRVKMQLLGARITNGYQKEFQAVPFKILGQGHNIEYIKPLDQGYEILIKHKDDPNFLITFDQPFTLGGNPFSVFHAYLIWVSVPVFFSIFLFLIPALQRLSKKWAEESKFDFLTKRSLRFYCISIFALMIVHRFAIFGIYYDEIKAYMLSMGNGEILTWQYSSIDCFRHDFLKNLWYLQQNPPVPELIFGFCIKVFPWPVGTHFAMSLLQGIINATTTSLALIILAHFTQAKHYWKAALLLLTLGFSISTVTMEYNWFGQSVYENFCILMLAFLFLGFIKFQKSKKLKWVALMGISVALLALTRSTFCYLFPLPLIFLLVESKFRRAISISATYLICVFVLQFGWSIKNKIVFDYFTISNSSWKGSIILAGSFVAGYGDDFYDFIIENESKYPDWFIEMLKDKGRIVFWSDIADYDHLVPQEILDYDKELFSKVDCDMRFENRMSIKVLSDIYATVYKDFVKSNPAFLIEKFGRGWAAVWRPIKEYPYLFIAPFYTKPMTPVGIDLWDAFQDMVPSSETDKVYLASPYNSKFEGDSVYLFTINYLPNIVRILNIINMTIIPFILPIILLLILTGKVKLEGKLLAYLLIVGVVYYLICSVSLIQCGREQCRYRIPVEVFIWSLLFINTQWLYGKGFKWLKKDKSQTLS